jgi:hypothetical protein
MKKTISLLSFLFYSVFLFAQVSKPATPENAFGDALSKVVIDFAANFNTVQGNKMPADVEADCFKSKVCLPGALGCKIMRYRSVEDKSASWQAFMYAGESYEEALKMYKKLYGLVKKTVIKGIDGGSFDGKMETVDESVGFAVTPLRLKTKGKRYKNLIADIEITSNYSGWQVQLNIYTKKAEADGNSPEQ